MIIIEIQKERFQKVKLTKKLVGKFRNIETTDRLDQEYTWKMKMLRSLRMGLHSCNLNEHRRHRTCIFLPLIFIHNKALYSFCHAKNEGKVSKKSKVTYLSSSVILCFHFCLVHRTVKKRHLVKTFWKFIWLKIVIKN